MKIKKVILENVKKYVGHWEFDGFGDRVSLMIAPNEFGKSTLFEAIRSLILFKHKSTIAFHNLAPLGAPGEKPEVTMVFTINGEEWTLYKKFAGQSGKATLKSATQNFANDEAEEKLKDLFGTDNTGQAAKTGVWGALWVAQSESMKAPVLDDPARSTLTGLIEAEVGQVTGGQRGQRILTKIRSELAETIGKNDQPVKKFREAKDKVAEAEVALANARAAEAEVSNELVRLEEVIDLLQSPSARQTLDDLKKQSEEASVAVTVAMESQAKADVAKAAAGQLASDLVAAQGKQARRAELREALEADKDVLAGASEKLKEAEDELAEKSAAISDAGLERRAAEDKLGASGLALGRAKKLVSLAEASGSLSKLTARLADATLKANEVENLEEKLAGNLATRETVVAIEQAHAARDKAEMLLKAGSPVIEFEIGSSTEVRIKGEKIASGSSTITATDIVEISLGDGSVIRVRPPANATQSDLRKKAIDAVAEASLSLDQVGATSLEDVHRLAGEREELVELKRIAQQKLDDLVSGDEEIDDGIDSLRQAVKAKEGEVATLKAALDVTDAPLLQDAKQSLVLAEEEHLEASAHNNRALTKEALAISLKANQETVVNGLRQRVEEVSLRIEKSLASLSSNMAGETDDELAERISKLERESAEKQIEAETAAAGVDLEAAKAREERLKGAFEQCIKNRHELENERHSIEGSIGSKRGAGEVRANAEVELAAVKIREAKLAEQVDVAKLLAAVLGESEKTTKDQYMSPVKDLVMKSLGKLLPGSVATMNIDMQIESLNRNGVDERIDKLSTGAAEQLAILVRLAFAEMLVSKGKPAMLILDDALVYSDDPRLDIMFDIIHEASSRMQIVVLSCHERMWIKMPGDQIRAKSLAATVSSWIS